LIKKYPKIEADGPKFLQDITNNINNGTFQFVGKGTINKDSGVLDIYRGKGLTVVTKPNGEWVTLLGQGKAMDLNIMFIK